MLSTFFQTIPQGVNEVFAVGTLIGAALAWYLIKRKGTLFWFIWGAMLFMIGWRVAIQIISSRYASMLIYPAVILTVYACFQSEVLLEKIPSWPARIRRYVPYAILCGIVIASIAQVLHFNPYAGHFQKGYQVIMEHKHKERVTVWGYDREEKRIEYYTGIKPRPLPQMEAKSLSQELRNVKTADMTLLLDLQVSSKQPVWTRQELGLSESEEWELLFSSYTNRRKHRKHLIYRYKPAVSAKVIAPGDTAMATENLLENGNLEQLYSSKESFQRLPVFMRNHPLFKGTDFQMPRNAYYWINNKKMPPEEIPQIELISTNCLQGKYSLRIKAWHDEGDLVFSQRFKPGKYRLSAWLKGKPGTQVRLFLNTTKNGKFIGNYTVADFEIPDEQVYELSTLVTENDLRSGDSFAPAVWIKNGEAILDGFSLLPYARQ